MAHERPGPAESGTFTNPLKSFESELSRQEIVKVNVIEGIQWTYPRKFSSGYGMFPDETPSAPMPPLTEGLTWEEYARTVPEGVVGIWEVKQLQGKTIIDGVEVPVTSGRFYTNGVRYIDGQVFSLEEALQQPGVDLEVIKGFALIDERNKAVLTRSGTWEPFEEGDSIISTSLPSESK